MKIALDTNILIRFANRDDAAHPAVRGRIETLLKAKHMLCFPAQCVYEYWAVATRSRERENGIGLTIDETQRSIKALLRVFFLLPDPPDLLTRWLYLCTRHRVEGLASHDTRIVAWMMANQIDSLFTLNPKDFSRYTENELIEST